MEKYEVKLVVVPEDRNMEGDITRAEVSIYVKGVSTDVVEFLEKIIEAAIYSKWFDGNVIGINDNSGEWIKDIWKIWRR